MIPELVLFDYSFLSFVQTFQSPIADSVMRGISFVGNPIFWMIIAAIIYWLGKANESFYVMNLVLFSSAIVGALKINVARGRPNPEMFRVIATDTFLPFSFPSGHATLTSSVLYHLGHFVKNNVKIIFALIVGFVALSRLYLGAHYLSDVIAGLVLGILIGELNFRLVNKVRNSKYRPSKLQDELIVVAIIVIAIIMAFFVSSIPLIAILLGFYAGFFWARETLLYKNWQPEKGLRKNVIKLACGFLGLGLLAGVVMYAPETIIFGFDLAYITYFIAGMWISLIYPELYQQFLRKVI